MSTNREFAAKLYEGGVVEMRSQQLSPEEIASQLYRYDRIAPLLNSLDNIGANEIRKYKEQGFLAVANFLSGEEVERSIEALMNLIFIDAKGAKIQFTKPQDQLHSREEREKSVRKVHEYVAADEVLRGIAYHPKLLAKVREILGEEPVLVQDMALLKPPHGGGEK